uniref:NADH-ubiquinone oxidoreductase chain 2 n=1 Tax=Flaccisagitta enflata TaxID=366393 RepID=D3DKN5_9BILA|nr:NADH dehydrogenase subunit 2 [Flaccisagitta enflata]BAI68184.1 NADH dehydrogenase subunit 2 [Flaccisagitta enflata]
MFLGIFMGLIIILSSSHWPIIWLGFELNMMCFLACFLKEAKKQAMLYFILQSLGSLLILGASFLSESKFSFLNLIILALVLKLGAAPLHFWLVIVIPRLSPLGLFLIMSFQKMAPLFLLSSLPLSKDMVSLSNLFLGSIMMLSLSSPLMVMIFSGVSQMGWMFIIPPSFLKIYMFIYFIILAPVIFYLYSSSLNFFFSMLNVAGLPPFSGFIIKVKAILSLSKKKAFLFLSASGIALSSYSRLLLNKSFSKDKLSFLTLFSLLVGMV